MKPHEWGRVELRMKTVKLISWHSEAAAKAASLQQRGVAIDAAPLVRTSAVVGEMASLNPAVLVLDLDRLPSHAREIALALRASKSARHIPILLVGALPSTDVLPETCARLRSELADLPYAAWPEARHVIATMLKEPGTATPIVPGPRVYTTSLAQKLGILPGAGKSAATERRVALVGEPDGFVELLGDLPGTVAFTPRITAETHLAVCFIRSIADLAATLDLLTLRLPLTVSAWIAYPKRAVHRHLDFNENDVRNLSLAAGFVDYKICSIDASWSALKFAHRKRG